MKDLPTLSGEKVYLAPMPDTPQFCVKYAEWLNSEKVQFGISDKPGDCFYTDQGVKKILKEWEDDPLVITFCVHDSETLQPVGDVFARLNADYESVSEESRALTIKVISIETGVMIADKNHARKGFAFEAMSLLLEYLTQLYSDAGIYAEVFFDNIPALKLHEKLGYSFNGILEKSISKRNEYLMIYEG